MCITKHLVICCFIFIGFFEIPNTFLSAAEKEGIEYFPELQRLKEFDPMIDLHIPPNISKNEMFPTPSQLNILFAALRYCQNDLKKMQKDFPDLFIIFRPQILYDFDDDGELEVVMNLSGYTGDSTWIWIADSHAGIFRYIEYKDEHPMATEVILTNEKEIALRRPKSKKIPIKGTNKLVTLEFILQTVIKFTGDAIEVIRPYEVIDECLVP